MGTWSKGSIDNVGSILSVVIESGQAVRLQQEHRAYSVLS